jgi:hypothetical protein
VRNNLRRRHQLSFEERALPVAVSSTCTGCGNLATEIIASRFTYIASKGSVGSRKRLPGKTREQLANGLTQG